MAKTRLTEDEIKAVLAEHAAGKSVPDLVKAHKISAATFYNWKAKFGGGTAPKAKRSRPPKAKVVLTVSRTAATPAPSALADENRRLKIMIVDLMLEVERLRRG